MKLVKFFILTLLFMSINSCLDRNLDEIKNIPTIGNEQSYTIFNWNRIGFHFIFSATA